MHTIIISAKVLATLIANLDAEHIGSTKFDIVCDMDGNVRELHHSINTDEIELIDLYYVNPNYSRYTAEEIAQYLQSDSNFQEFETVAMHYNDNVLGDDGKIQFEIIE